MFVILSYQIIIILSSKPYKLWISLIINKKILQRANLSFLTNTIINQDTLVIIIQIHINPRTNSYRKMNNTIDYFVGGFIIVLQINLLSQFIPYS